MYLLRVFTNDIWFIDNCYKCNSIRLQLVGYKIELSWKSDANTTLSVCPDDIHDQKSNRENLEN